jgi:hypothetical protein
MTWRAKKGIFKQANIANAPLGQYPVRIGTIRLPQPDAAELPLDPGDTYVYTDAKHPGIGLDLGALYESVVIENIEWVEAPEYAYTRFGFNFGAGALNTETSGGALMITEDPEDTRRLFELVTQEYVDDSDPVSRPVFERMGTNPVLGYGDDSKAVPFDNSELYGYNFQIQSVYLDNSGATSKLVVEVKNSEAGGGQSFNLAPYTGATATGGDITNNKLCDFQLVFDPQDGNCGIVTAQTAAGTTGGTWYTDDSGDTWQAVPSHLMGSAFGASCYHDGSDLFLALVDYEWEWSIYDTNSGWNTYNYRATSYGNNTMNDETVGRFGMYLTTPGGLAGGNNPGYGGRTVDFTADILFHMCREDCFVRLFSTTDITTTAPSEIFAVETCGLFTDYDTRVSNSFRQNGSTPIAYLRAVDANNLFAAFTYYTDAGSPTGNAYGVMKNAFVKTTDGGSNWSQVCTQDDFMYGGEVCVFQSTDGDQIGIALFAFDRGITGYTFPYSDGDIRFNYSDDGGATWTYSDGSWPLINTGNYNAQIRNPISSKDRALAAEAVLAWDSTLDQWLLIYRNTSLTCDITRSTDGTGGTWTAPQQLEAFTSGASWRAYTNEATEKFLAFCMYGYYSPNQQGSWLFSGDHIYQGVTVDAYTNWHLWGIESQT